MKEQRKPAVVGLYPQKTVRERIEAFFLENVAKVATRSQVQEAARNPETGVEPENWHQRLSELRTDSGYTILTNRDDASLKPGEYVLVSPDKRKGAGKRITCSKATWVQVLERAKNSCEWDEGGERCLLEDGSVDPVGGGTVRLTPDHMTPHSVKSAANPDDVRQWRALCGRHQVIKKNFWDSASGELNLHAILQAASLKNKKMAYKFLRDFFKDQRKDSVRKTKS